MGCICENHKTVGFIPQITSNAKEITDDHGSSGFFLEIERSFFLLRKNKNMEA